MKLKSKKAYIFLLIVAMLVNTITVFGEDVDEWKDIDGMSSIRYHFGAAEVDGKIYAVGGYSGTGSLNSIEEYDPSTEKWTTKSSMSIARHANAVASYNGKLYAIGGTSANGAVEEYDPINDHWTTKSSMPTSRGYLSAVAVDGKIYAIGGRDANGDAIGAVEEYDPINDHWTTKTNMINPREAMGVAVYNKEIYLFGGTTGEQKDAVTTIDKYNPATDAWTHVGDMTTARSYMGAATINGLIYLVGGNSKLEAYNPLTNAWIEKSDLTTSRFGLAVAAIGNSIYAIGGKKYSTVETIQVTDEVLSETITITAEKTTVKMGEEFSVNVVLNNVANIYAEDVKVSYDTSKFEYIGYENIADLKVYHQDHSSTEGAIRTIVASLGEDKSITGSNTMYSLKFKAIGKGEGIIDSTAGRIANISSEWDIDQDNCGQITINVEGYQDVNRSGEFTLLDLAIDAFYYNNFAAVDSNKHDADVVIDNTIDDLDLNAIVNEMLINANYIPNN